MTIKLPSQTQIFLWFLRKEYQLVVKYQFWKKELIRSFPDFLFFNIQITGQQGKKFMHFRRCCQNGCKSSFAVKAGESLSKHTIYSSMQHDMMNDFHILNCFCRKSSAGIIYQNVFLLAYDDCYIISIVSYGDCFKRKLKLVSFWVQVL